MGQNVVIAKRFIVVPTIKTISKLRYSFSEFWDHIGETLW